MTSPPYFLKETSLYVLITFLLIIASLLQKMKGDSSYVDTLIFLAFPGLISGILFQMYSTIQGYPFRGQPLVYVNLILWMINIAYFFSYGRLEPNLNLLFCLSFLFIIFINTRKVKDPSVLFFLMGALFYALAALMNLKASNPLFIKHLMTAGFFMPVVIGSYYVFVPMLQIESLRWKNFPWINLTVQFLSSSLLSLSWYISHYKLISYSGFLLLLSVGMLSYGVYDMLSQRKSPIKGLDVSVQFLILGLFVCWFSLLMGILTAMSGNYGFLKLHVDGMLYGFLTTITVGASYHIVPFLLWWKVHAPRMGKEKIPTLKEILDIKVAKLLLLAIPPILTGLPFEERVFSLLLALAIGYYTVKLAPLTLKTLKA